MSHNISLENHKKNLLTLFALFAADGHKLIINTIIAIFGAQKSLGQITPIIDIVVSIVLFLTCILYSVISYKEGEELWHNGIVISQLIYLAVLILSLIFINHNNESIYNFSRFLGGNLLLLFGSLVFVEDKKDVVYIIHVWLLTSILLSLISTYFFLIGATYTSIRAKIIPGVDIRVGYFTAIAYLYLIICKDRVMEVFNNNRIIYIGILVLFTFSILTSGSKISLLLLTFLLTIYLVMNIEFTKDLLKKLGAGILVLIIFLIGLFYLNNGKYGSNIFDFTEYVDSVMVRIPIYLEYFKEGLKSPIFGLGISAAYNVHETYRTHSIITSMFVQTGFIGVMTYVTFVYNSIKLSIELLRQKLIPEEDETLVLFLFYSFIFAILFAEVVSDIPGNRFVWLFSGLTLRLSIFYNYDHKSYLLDILTNQFK